jgi:hypothetical protein
MAVRRRSTAVVALALLATSGLVFSGGDYLAPIGLFATVSLALIIATFTPLWSGAIINQRVDHLRSLEHRRGAVLRAVASGACLIPPGGRP